MYPGYNPLSGSANLMAGPGMKFKVGMRSGSRLLLSNSPPPSPSTSTLSMVRTRTIDFHALGSGDADVLGRVISTRHNQSLK